jgi:hypothetical protein
MISGGWRQVDKHERTGRMESLQCMSMEFIDVHSRGLDM